MEEIRLGLEANIDVTPYLNPSIKAEEMERIRKKLESKNNNKLEVSLETSFYLPQKYKFFNFIFRRCNFEP